jgi:hydrogenase nickel incorporation protein HypA/HybF
VHEWSIVHSLLDEVERCARARGARAIHRLHLRVGTLSGVETGLLETAYATFREGTLCAAARLEIERVPARWACPRCRVELAPGAGLSCGGCGAAARLESGDEIVLARIEMEFAEEPAARAAGAGEGA